MTVQELRMLAMRDLKRRISEERQRQILRPFFEHAWQHLDAVQQVGDVAEAEYARRILGGMLAGAGGVDQDQDGVG